MSPTHARKMFSPCEPPSHPLFFAGGTATGRPAGCWAGWRVSWGTCGKRVRASQCVRCARAESMPKWVNQCKHGTEVTADSPRARSFATTTSDRAESCVYACQLSGHRRPAGDARIICIGKNKTAHTADRRNNIFFGTVTLLLKYEPLTHTHIMSQILLLYYASRRVLF